MINDEQRKARKLGIGGSDMPIILGLSTYKTPYQLYLEKTSDTHDEQEESPLQYWGNLLENVIREEFATRNQVVVETPDTLIHPFYDFLRGNVDGYIREQNAILEVKCSHQFMASQWGEPGSDVIPLQYLVQIAFYCMIANAECAYLAVLIGGNDYREYTYKRDFVLEETLLDAAKNFWHLVTTKTPPPASSQIDLRLMYLKEAPEKIKTIAKPIAEQLTSLSETRFKIKELSELEDRYKFNIMQFMEDAECLCDEVGTPLVTWRANKRGSRQFLVKGV